MEYLLEQLQSEITRAEHIADTTYRLTKDRPPDVLLYTHWATAMAIVEELEGFNGAYHRLISEMPLGHC